MSAILERERSCCWSIPSRPSHHNSSPAACWGKAAKAEKTRDRKPWFGTRAEAGRVQLDSTKTRKALAGHSQQWPLIRDSSGGSVMAEGTRKVLGPLGTNLRSNSQRYWMILNNFKVPVPTLKIQWFMQSTGIFVMFLSKVLLPKETLSSHLPSRLCAWFLRTNPKLSYFTFSTHEGIQFFEMCPPWMAMQCSLKAMVSLNICCYLLLKLAQNGVKQACRWKALM